MVIEYRNGKYYKDGVEIDSPAFKGFCDQIQDAITDTDEMVPDEPEQSDVEAVTIEEEPVKTLEDIKAEKINMILDYDSSNAVNLFFLNDEGLWLDKLTRMNLKMRLEAEESIGKEETTLWFEGRSYNLPVQACKDMLVALEIYASECYDNTQRHIAVVKEMDNIDDILSYDHAAGYPDMLVFRN